MKIQRAGNAFGATVLSLAVLAMLVLGIQKYVAERLVVPWVNMWMWFEDDTGMAKRGTATLRTPVFRVSWEGQSFFPKRSGGEYIVDGRYGSSWYRTFFKHEEDDFFDTGDGMMHAYSQRRRLCMFRYRGHDIAYSNALQKLTVDGHEFSTADGQVSVVIKENGQIELAPIQEYE